MKITPSRLELASNCPASPKRCEPFPFEDSPAAARGCDLHERTAIGLKSGPFGYAASLDGLSVDDAKLVKICWEVAETLRPKGPHKVYVETKLDLGFLGMPSGTPDLVYFDEDSETIVVIDWKFGHGPVPDPMENKQLIAYVIGVAQTLKWLFKQAYIVVCQPDPSNKPPYRDALIPAQDFPDWEERIKTFVNKAQEENAPALPGPWCKGGFCAACKHETCPENIEWAGKRAKEKQEAKTGQALAAVSGFNPVSVDGVPGPIVVIDAAAVEKAESYRTRALTLAVSDQSSADIAGLCLSEITKFKGQVELSRKTVKAPVIELGRRIDGEADKAFEPLTEAENGLKSRLNAWKKEEDAKREMERQESERKICEAQEAQRKAEEESRKAQQEALNAKTKAAREEAARKLAEAEAERAKAQVAAQIPLPEPVAVKIAGVRTQKVPVFEVIDFASMPDTYKLPNEALIKKAITTKALTGKEPWLKVEWVEQSSSTGRR